MRSSSTRLPFGRSSQQPTATGSVLDIDISTGLWECRQHGAQPLCRIANVSDNASRLAMVGDGTTDTLPIRRWWGRLCSSRTA